MEYYVLSPDGQKFGPATVAILNQWIQEGRIAPDTLLQDAASGAQIVARALPALSFAPQPMLAPPDANPYTMASPAQNPAYYSSINQTWNQPPGVSSSQVLGGWACTILSPVLIVFCYLGLAAALYGCVTGGQLLKQGNKVAGGVMIGINVLWILLFALIRFASFI